MTENNFLTVKDLHVTFDTYAGSVYAVRGVSFHVKKGEAVAIVGESGCGKSVTVHAAMQLIPTPPGRIDRGEIFFDDKDLLTLSEREMQQVRGRDIGMIFQDPMTSLNPTMSIGKQIGEGLLTHQKVSVDTVRTKVVELLELAGISEPDKRYDQYPHEFSGGMRQRVMIAIALACNPRLLIADEPTTALDVTIQAQILDLMKELQQKLGMSIVMITHNLGVVAEMVERVIVMYAGKIMETGTLDEIFYRPQHPYTLGLMLSVPHLKMAHKAPLLPIDGSPPDLFSPPAGCPFAPRCEMAMKICLEHMPPDITLSQTQTVACWILHPAAPRNENRERT